jgi:hypothetical protein
MYHLKFGLFLFLQILHFVGRFRLRIRGSAAVQIKFYVFLDVEPSSDGSSRFHQSVGIYAPHHTTSHSP